MHPRTPAPRLCASLVLGALLPACSNATAIPVPDLAVSSDLALHLDLAASPPDLTAAPDLPFVFEDAFAPPDLAGCIPSSGSSNLQGATLSYTGPGCTFTLAEAAAGLHLSYRFTTPIPVDATPGVPDTESCPQPAPNGLYFHASVDGNGQSYCVCDSGLCQTPHPAPVHLAADSYAAALDWTGRNWTGPSDTNNPLGKPFPAGHYTFHVVTKGTFEGQPFSVFLDVPITLVP